MCSYHLVSYFKNILLLQYPRSAQVLETNITIMYNTAVEQISTQNIVDTPSENIETQATKTLVFVYFAKFNILNNQPTSVL